MDSSDQVLLGDAWIENILEEKERILASTTKFRARKISEQNFKEWNISWLTSKAIVTTSFTN